MLLPVRCRFSKGLFSLMLNVFRRVPQLRQRCREAGEIYWSAMERHKLYISEHGKDMPEIADWRWSPA
jgi:xylulose-5-phosphate/fructose-6-phosphate phosphoketolase